MAETNPPITVVNIIAVSYSGSTWVNMMLGAHSQAFGCGEIDWIVKAGKAICSLHGDDCPVWTQYDPASDENPYLQMARITGKRVLVVNNPRRLLHAQNHPQIQRRFLWVIRDGRAVVASSMRKYKEVSTWKACRNWRRNILKKRKLIRSQPTEHTMKLIYEEVVNDTPDHLRKICDFLELPFQPAMLEYRTAPQHPIGGNPGAVSMVADAQNVTALHNALVNRLELPKDQAVIDASRNAQIDLDFYRKNKQATVRDERWKKELSDRQLRLFALLAGRLNRSFGYPPSMQRD